MASLARLAAGAGLIACTLSGLAYAGYAMGSGADAPQGIWVPVPPRAQPVTATSPAASPTATAAPSRRTVPPAITTGRYAFAATTSSRFGTGTLRRYQVAVEAGIGVEAGVFARAVEETLSDRHGWTAAGKWAFQRVGPAQKPDFVIRLATPATVDKVCATAGLRTLGEVSCQAGTNVMINLKRWLWAIPAYAGDVRGYQHLVVNHEVGHFLGFGHVGCPGQGQPAPAMMAQYFGLDGCRPNPWPHP